MLKSLPVVAQIMVSGRVQRVGFRDFSCQCATSLQLFGTVQNCSDGCVSLTVEGERSVIETFIDQLWQGSNLSEVTNISVSWPTTTPRASNFSIVY